MKKHRKIAYSSILTALAVVLLYIAGLLPAGRIAGSAIAALAIAACVIECGLAAGCAVYAVSSLTAALLVPDKLVVFLYIAGFGLYAVLKSLIERMHNLKLEFLFKFAVFNVILVSGYYGAVFLNRFLRLIPEFEASGILYIIALGAANLLFLVYDIGLSRLIGFYTARIQNKRKSGSL